METLTGHPIFNLLDKHISSASMPNENDLKMEIIRFHEELIAFERESDICQFYRLIRGIEIKIACIKSKCNSDLKIRLFEAILSIVKTERELLCLRLKHPESFIKLSTKHKLFSNLKWIGNKCDIMELILAFVGSGLVTTMDGAPLTQIMVVKYFEQLFNIDLKRPVDLKNQIYRRKKESTPFMERLKQNIEQQIENYYKK